MPTRRFPICDIKGILIASPLGDIEVEFVDGDMIIVDYDNPHETKDALDFVFSNQMATLTPNLDGLHGLDMDAVSLAICVAVPTNCIVMVHSQQGDIKVRGFASKIDIETDSGDINVFGHGNLGKFKTITGTVCIKGQFDDLLIETESGDIDLQFKDRLELSKSRNCIISESGFIKLDSSYTTKSLIQMDVQNEFGDISLCGSLESFISKSECGDITIEGDISHCQGSTSKGNLAAKGTFRRINLNSDDGDIKLQLQNQISEQPEVQCLSKNGLISIDHAHNLSTQVRDF